MRVDHPERVSAAALLIGCACLGATTIILAVAAYLGKEVSGSMVAACGALSALVGYSYGKAKTAEVPK